MRLKDILQARLDSLKAVLAQAGKRLSAATIEKINAAIATLSDLMGVDEPEAEAVEQAWQPVGEMLSQAMVTGESTADSYEKQKQDVWRALDSASKSLLGAKYYIYVVYTWPTHVVFQAERYNEEISKWETKTYRADYAVSNGAYTFSNLHAWTLLEVGVAIQSALLAYEDALTQNQDKPFELGDPTSYMLEQDGDNLPLLLQVLPGSVRLSQAKSKDGKVVFNGIATHGSVLNLNNPPLVYPTKLWQSQLPRVQDLVAQGRFYGTLDHKVDSQGKARMPAPDELSHKFTTLSQDGDLFPFEAEVLQTSAGKELAALLQSGVGLDMSTVASGKVKKGEWLGQKAYIVQEDGFIWHGVDVVLNGASPGSAITDVRLQSLDAGPKKENAMDPKEIQKLIDDAIAAGNNDVATQLQALKDQIESLKQAAPTLSDEDKAIIAQAKEIVAQQSAEQAARARDTKAETFVAGLIQAEEIPAQFKVSAVKFLQSACTTADDVEGKKTAMMDMLTPLIEQNAVLQSKGMVMSQYRPVAGEINKKKPVDDLPTAVEELVQEQIQKGTVVDNGKQDFSNTARSLRVMAQTLVNEKPVFGQAYWQFRNGQITSLEQCQNIFGASKELLMQDIPAGAMTTSDISGAVPQVLPIMMDVYPQLIAMQLGTLQPFTKSTGRYYAWKVKDEGGNDMSQVANFTGSYANNPGEKQTIKRLKGNIAETDIATEIKKLGYDLSIEVMRHMATDYSVDGSAAMLAACSDEIAREWNYIMLQEMVSGATAGNVNYGTDIPANSSFDGEQWQKQFTNFVLKARGLVWKARFADTTWIIGDSDAIDLLIRLNTEVGAYNGNGQGRIAAGVNIVGSLSTGEKLIKVGWWDTLCPNKLLVAGKGSQWPMTGYVICPYLGLYITPPWVDPDTHDYQQSMQSEMAHKVVDGKYFATITVQQGVAGTPL